jgi:hypothetical protein
MWNHFTELIAPFFVFGPRPARHVAGLLLVFFQILLIFSGNLSFINRGCKSQTVDERQVAAKDE